jgi:hypothetical protein
MGKTVNKEGGHGALSSFSAPTHQSMISFFASCRIKESGAVVRLDRSPQAVHNQGKLYAEILLQYRAKPNESGAFS